MNPRDRKLSDVEVQWNDAGREPQCASDPAFPNGVILDISDGAAVTCKVALPYPARRCGHYALRCTKCGLKVAVTTAGRRDDPCGTILPCHAHELNPSKFTRIISEPKKVAP